MHSLRPGKMVQIDHMSVSVNQITVKHFQAWDPKSKYIQANVYSNATSRTAKQFLLELIENTPFKITSIQVDGGSEFMLHFEEACAELDIELYVLPLKRPQYNGGVERGNRTFREEYYARHDMLADSVGALNSELQKAVLKYNSYRPHANLNLNFENFKENSFRVIGVHDIINLQGWKKLLLFLSLLMTILFGADT